jgi:hypothetical protein
MRKVIDGLRMIDGTNNASDLALVNYASGNTSNSTSVDMIDHSELLVHAMSGTLLGTATLTLIIQESDEAAANFTNVAFINFAAADDAKNKLASIDWNHPDRKRYARLSGVVANNTVEYAAATIRVRNKMAVTTDTNIVTG